MLGNLQLRPLFIVTKTPLPLVPANILVPIVVRQVNVAPLGPAVCTNFAKGIAGIINKAVNRSMKKPVLFILSPRICDFAFELSDA